MAIFWDIASFNLYRNQRFGRTYYLLLQGANWADEESGEIAENISPKTVTFINQRCDNHKFCIALLDLVDCESSVAKQLSAYRLLKQYLVTWLNNLIVYHFKINNLRGDRPCGSYTPHLLRQLKLFLPFCNIRCNLVRTFRVCWPIPRQILGHQLKDDEMVPEIHEDDNEICMQPSRKLGDKSRRLMWGWF
jgi:hypothetical protein